MPNQSGPIYEFLYMCSHGRQSVMMQAVGQKQMTPKPIKTKENYGINQCQEVKLQPLGLSKVKKKLLNRSTLQEMVCFF